VASHDGITITSGESWHITIISGVEVIPWQVMMV